ncbi:peptidoglycan-binding domain-containing protein [Catenulispora pinisilvae]|uniref:peptidoglycan-binding domain-containing protein n=1 Tax=Catenulispora pinisilvae TaxID=2705253 RepID=UPI001891665A|nr:peptidoglycan-binding protein [Catenulispora pinisilvae]
MADRTSAQPLRRRFTALVVGVLAVGGTTLAASAPAHAEDIGFCSHTNAQPELTVGSQGVAVQQAQCELDYAYAYGHSTNYGQGSYNGLAMDGDFGQNTEAATKNFQIHCMGVSNPDGIIGPNTWNALNQQINTGFYC